MMRFFLVIFTLLPIAGFALETPEDCPKGNFTSNFGSVRGSGGAEWCWANTAADLIGYAQGIKPPDRISAIDVATSNLTISPEETESTVKSLGPAGMNSNRIGWYQNQIGATQDLMKSYSVNKATGLPSTALLSYQSRKGFCLEKNLKVDYSSTNSYIADYIKSIAARVGGKNIEKCSDRSPNAVNNVQNFNLELNRKILSEIEFDLEAQCNPRTPMKPMLPSTVDLSADPLKRSATDFIKLGLNNGLPIAIAFDSNLLTKDSYSKEYDHTGIITESRFSKDSGRCEYRLRDSNGSDCSIYREALRKKCDKGYIWLTGDEINDSTGIIMAVDKPSE